MNACLCMHVFVVLQTQSYITVVVLQRALGEFPEKELQLHQTEAQGQTVLARTSEKGKVHILQDLKRLRESWTSLHTLSLNLYRLEEVMLAVIEGVDGITQTETMTQEA